MARNTDDFCLICEQQPCGCTRVRPSRRTERPTKTESPQVTTSSPSALEAMVADSRRYMPEKAAPKPSDTFTDDDQDLVDGIKVAIRLLGAQFVDPADERAMRAALAEPDSPRLRASEWRARREER